jgi:hypothetical protein
MLNLGLKLKMAKDPSGASGLSDDTSLSVYTIDSEDVLELSNISRGNGVTEVPVSATPTHPGASRTINGSSNPDPVAMALSTGDNICTVTVTAEDGVTTEDHVVTVRRLTAGVQEITVANFHETSLSNFATGSSGEGLIISNGPPGSNGRFGLWGQTGTESQPDWSSFDVDSYLGIFIDAEATYLDIANAFEAALAGIGFEVTSDDGTLTIIDPVHGAREDATFSTALGAIATLNVTQQGENPS